MIKIKFIPKEDILTILPLITQLNTKTPQDLIAKRLIEMTTQNYKCVGMYLDGELIGISGIWF
ncbi:MAG: hypothetical protein V3V14_05955, partial [Saprospiraceae bacterium]